MHAVQPFTVYLLKFQNWDKYDDIHNGSVLNSKVEIEAVTSK